MKDLNFKEYYYKYKALKYYLKNNSIPEHKIKGGLVENNQGTTYEGQKTEYYSNGKKNYEGEWKMIKDTVKG